LGTREFEQHAFLPKIFQDTFIYVQGDVIQKGGLVRVQRDVSDRVFEEESGEGDEEMLSPGGKFR
jgi:hypothetical protein